MAVKTDITYIRLSAETVSRILASEITFQSITASDIVLDAFSINQFPKNAFDLYDSTAFAFSKVQIDSITLTEGQVISIQKQLSDVIGLNDTVDILLIIQREFTESLSISDVRVLGVDKVLSETLTLAEQTLIEFETTKSDAVTSLDAQSLTTGLFKADEVLLPIHLIGLLLILGSLLMRLR